MERNDYHMKQADRIYYGGDYNPDQWDEATIAEDMRLFKKAGINLLTLPVFSVCCLPVAQVQKTVPLLAQY